MIRPPSLTPRGIQPHHLSPSNSPNKASSRSQTPSQASRHNNQHPDDDVTAAEFENADVSPAASAPGSRVSLYASDFSVARDPDGARSKDRSRSEMKPLTVHVSRERGDSFEGRTSSEIWNEVAQRDGASPAPTPQSQSHKPNRGSLSQKRESISYLDHSQIAQQGPRGSISSNASSLTPKSKSQIRDVPPIPGADPQADDQALSSGSGGGASSSEKRPGFWKRLFKKKKQSSASNSVQEEGSRDGSEAKGAGKS
jgi:hypothetical protein